MMGGPTGGAAYTSHSWSGSGSSNLNTTTAQNVSFTSSTAGAFDLTYTVTDANNCTATDNIQVNVTTSVTPSITSNFIDGSAVICEGELVSLEAIGVNEGSTPIHKWYKNGNVVSTTSAYSSSSLSNGDVLYCELTSSATCASPQIVQSTNIVMTVKPVPTKPTISVNVDVLTSSIPQGNQWEYNGAAITGAMNTSYQMTQNGNYTVYVIQNGCKSPVSDVFIMNNVGIDEITLGQSIDIYPNPSSDYFTINLADFQAKSYFIFNAYGALVDQGDIQSKTWILDLSHVVSGIYLLQITGPSGNKISRIEKQ
jgi:hypothetical protein